jgi:hypothetical protein
MDSPSQSVEQHGIEQALEKSELRSVVECAAGAHSDIMRDSEEVMPCAEKYGVQTMQICLTAKLSVVKCEYSRTNKLAFNYIITKSAPIAAEDTNGIMESLEESYKSNANFGIVMTENKDSWLMSAGGGKYSVPPAIVKAAELAPGQLVYISQIEFKAPTSAAEGSAVARPSCARGELSVMRFGRWSCAPAGAVRVCAGDTIWDAEQQDCVGDPRRRQLCPGQQTAVLIDEVWQCVDPMPDKQCSRGMTLRLNYSTFVWECVKDPDLTEKMKKCIGGGTVVRGAVGSTVRVQTTMCTDCEESITDMDTCETACVPSAAKLGQRSCYPNPSSCGGAHKAFYFGFPATAKYQEKARGAITGLTASIPTGAAYSANRMFNCLDCGAGYIDNSRSAPPFVAVCE